VWRGHSIDAGRDKALPGGSLRNEIEMALELCVSHQPPEMVFRRFSGLVSPNTVKLRTTFRGLRRAAWARALGKGVWSHVTLLLTMRCDCACGYCDFPRHAGPEMDTDSVLRLLELLARCGTVRLSVSGGEPLLRPDLPRILESAAQLGLVTSLVTNGRLLDEVSSCLPTVDYLLCTVEGDSVTHDAIRGAGVWQRLQHALAPERRAFARRLGFICPVHRDNLGKLEQPLLLARQHGAMVFFQPVQERAGWKGEAIAGVAPPTDIERAFRRLADLKQRGWPVGNSLRYLHRVAAGGVHSHRDGCLAGRFFATILPDGRVTPCCMLPMEGIPRRLGPDTAWLDLSPEAARYCPGCTIAPYVETSWLLSGDPGAWRNALRWKKT
jgi:MoaA/NifB/PqqE/SkfB family radical SAM enzyme